MRALQQSEFRDIILEHFRVGLGGLVNPETGQPFTETEIATATSTRSRWYVQADGVSLVCLGLQERGQFLARQLLPRTASHEWLAELHAEQWGQPFLPAVGASGIVGLYATGPGVTWPGSTTIGDPAAVVGRGPNGQRYQLLQTTTITNLGLPTPAPLQAVGTGPETNLAGETDGVPTRIEWENPPVGGYPSSEIGFDGMRGGSDAESDADYVDRLESAIRYRAGGGNAPQFRNWARAVSVNVADAFIYPCAFHAGSTLVCIVAKRLGNRSPSARIPAGGLLAQAVSYLTPPNSPAVPRNSHVVVVPPVLEGTQVTLYVGAARRSNNGFADANPWPLGVGSFATISFVTSATNFRVNAQGGAPAVTNPRIMVWVEATQSFVPLSVASVTPAGINAYDVTLVQPAPTPITPGMAVSPDLARRSSVADAVVAYFDTLGPGEVVSSSDPRYPRAARFPDVREERLSRADGRLSTYVTEALGGLYQGSSVQFSVTEPSLPTNPINGPRLLYPATVAVYPF